LIPIVGGLAGCIGFLIFPGHLRFLWWVPLVLDPGAWIALWALWNWKALVR
jgi:hypothetical protein